MKNSRFAVLIPLVILGLGTVSAIDHDGYPGRSFPGGSGTEEDPWQIVTPEHLNSVRYYLGAAHGDKHFKLMNDIDLTDEFLPGGAFYNNGQGWEPIGSPGSGHFAGRFNGDGHSIIGLYINRNVDYQGLFGYVQYSVIENIAVTNVDVTGKNIVGGLVGYNRGTVSVAHSTGSVNGGYRVGGLVGENNPGTVENSFSYAAVNANDGRIGGLVGFNVGGTVQNSHATGQVSGGWYVGGLVGRNLNGNISLSYATGAVSGNSCTGGLVGDSEGGSLSNSYAMGSVAGGWCSGGLVGYLWGMSVTNCFSTGFVTGGSDVGGLIGYRLTGTVSGSYWNTETSGQSASPAGFGRTTEEMTYPYSVNTYSGWDFTDIWRQDDGYEVNSGYPFLYWQPHEWTPVENDFHTETLNNTLFITGVFPNPMRSAVSITYTTPGLFPVSLEIYDTSGRLVRTGEPGTPSPGEHSTWWDGRDSRGAELAPGVYFIRLRCMESQAFARVVIVR